MTVFYPGLDNRLLLVLNPFTNFALEWSFYELPGLFLGPRIYWVNSFNQTAPIILLVQNHMMVGPTRI